MVWGPKTELWVGGTIINTNNESPGPWIYKNPGETAHVEVEPDFPASPTDDLIVAVYNSLDDSFNNPDDTPIIEFVISSTIDPHKRSFSVPPWVYNFRLGIRRSGTTDTIIVAGNYRLDGISL